MFHFFQSPCLSSPTIVSSNNGSSLLALAIDSVLHVRSFSKSLAKSLVPICTLFQVVRIGSDDGVDDGRVTSEVSVVFVAPVDVILWDSGSRFVVAGLRNGQVQMLHLVRPLLKEFVNWWGTNNQQYSNGNSNEWLKTLVNQPNLQASGTPLPAIDVMGDLGDEGFVGCHFEEAERTIVFFAKNGTVSPRLDNSLLALRIKILDDRVFPETPSL